MKDRGKGGVNSKSGFFLKFTKIPRKWLLCKDLWRKAGADRRNSLCSNDLQLF